MSQLRLSLIFCLLAVPAFAADTPTERAMGVKLMVEIQTGLRCAVDLLNVQDELVKAKARIKELEEAAKAKEEK